MRQSLGYVALVVQDYDEAIAFFTQTLRFELLEDTPIEGKRWVLVAPPGGRGTSLLLARATTPEQRARVGDQTGGRVAFFLHSDDFWRDYRELRAKGVSFAREPKEESYGTVAVFRDLYGNLWDLLELKDVASGAVPSAGRSSTSRTRSSRRAEGRVSKLVLIGGPPGVGKSSVLAALERKLERCACLDADDVRRFHPSEDPTGALGVRNVTSVLRGYLEAGVPLVILTWVLANPELIERVLRELEGLYGSLLVLHLVASPAALAKRCERQPDRRRPPEYVLLKLEQVAALPYPKIDTTGLGAEAVADLVAARIDEVAD